MKKGKILFLDFDGVLCDSSRETARTGWLAGSELWDEWKGSEIPENYLRKFIKLRPLLETGYEAIALLKSIDEGYSESFLIDKFNFMKEQVFTSVSMNRDKLIKLFGKVRDDWMRLSPASWLEWHSFYGCAGDIAAIAAERYSLVYIITTKQKIFVEKLLDYSGITFDPGIIHGLESGKSKELIISGILEAEGFSPDRAVILEDRVDTLHVMEDYAALDGALLYLASWGYVFPDDVLREEKNGGRIKVLYPESASFELEKGSC